MGGFDTLKQMFIQNKEWIEEDKLEEDNPTSECPYDAWTLEINERGWKSCPFCKRVWK